MKELVFVVKDPLGIHARPAGVLVKEAVKYASSIKVECGEKNADAKKIFSIMGLAAKCGDTLKFKFDGSDENEAYEGLKTFLENNL